MGEELARRQFPQEARVDPPHVPREAEEEVAPVRAERALPRRRDPQVFAEGLDRTPVAVRVAEADVEAGLGARIESKIRRRSSAVTKGCPSTALVLTLVGVSRAASGSSSISPKLSPSARRRTRTP